MGGRREAAMAIWRWQQGGQVRDDQARVARRHGSIRGGIALAVASGFWLAGSHTLALVAAAFGATTVAAALTSPLGLYRALTDALALFARGVGVVLTYVCLVPVYFLIITPFGLAARRGSRDPLHRQWSAQTPSFWTPRPATADAAERRKRPF